MSKSYNNFFMDFYFFFLSLFFNTKTHNTECPIKPIQPIMGNVFTYDDLPQECVNTLSSLFASCLDTINDIEQVERTLMDKLFWSERPVIKTVSRGEPWVVSLLESIVETASVVVPSTITFLTKFDSYIEFLNQETWKIVKQLTGEPQPEEENDESTKKKK